MSRIIVVYSDSLGAHEMAWYPEIAAMCSQSSRYADVFMISA